MTTNQERRLNTRAKLVQAAQLHFAQSGFENTLTDDILDEVGLSRGALYHHFKSKRELFEAVFISVSNDAVAQAAMGGSHNHSPLEDLISACLAWLRVMRRSEAATILLDQGPQVLGWKVARELESKSSLGLMIRGLTKAHKAGEVDVVSIELSARLINALLAEAALASLHKQPKISVAKQEALIRQFIEGLRP